MHTCKSCYSKKRKAERNQTKNRMASITIHNSLYNQKYNVPCAHCLTTDKSLKLYRDIDMVLCESCRNTLDRVCGSVKEMVIA